MNLAFAIKPDREYIRKPDSLGLEYEELRVNTPDGFELNTWVYQANRERDKNHVLVLAYPDAGNMSYFIYHSAILANHGYTVVTFDYRGFGESDDFEIEQDKIYYDEFAIDLTAVIDMVHQKFPEKATGIWAKSMGTIITVLAMDSLYSKVDFLISEGFVLSPERIAERVLEQKGKVLEYPHSAESYEAKLKNLEIPTLIFAGSQDDITTHQDALDIQKLIPAKCEVVLFEGEHLGGFNVGDGDWGAYYVGQINEFLENNF